ncbi:MAG: hypothetical protein OXG26_05265 [Caldilineaceae bacterium]|nr:hypothetical protein [Caldilineaceae bacterium]
MSGSMLTVPSPTTVTEWELYAVSVSARAIAAGAGDAVLIMNAAIRTKVSVATRPIVAFAEIFSFILPFPLETKVIHAATGELCTVSMTTRQQKEFHWTRICPFSLRVLPILLRVIGSFPSCLHDSQRLQATF